MIRHALLFPASKERSVVMQDDMEFMRTNDIWDLLDLPPGCKTIENKWVLKVKRKADDFIERYKAFLVAKGYT